MDGSMQRDDGLPGARRTGDSRRSIVVLFDDVALRGVEEDRPLLPGILERAR